MKVKGINPIEQNVEKIVLGVAGVALLGVVAVQLLGGSTVDVGGQSVELDRAYQPVKDEAVRVTAQMNEANPQMPEVPVVDLLGEYQAQAASPIAVRPRLAPMGPTMALSTEATSPDAAPITDAVYAAITIPAPSAPMAHSFRSTLNPVQVARNPEIAAIVPVSQPHDKSAVTIEATFNGRALQDILRTDPDGTAGPARPMPLRWWQDGLEIVAVRAERQSQSLTGQWSQPEPVLPLPGQMNLLTPPAGEAFNPVTLRTVVATARQMATQILRPDYFDVLAGQKWMPPSSAAKVQAIEAQRPEIERLRNQRRDIERQLAMQNQALEQAGGQANRPGEQGGHGDRQPQRTTTPTTPNPQVQLIQGRITALQEQLTRNEAQLEAIGVDLQGNIIATWEQDDTEGAYALPSLENPEVTLWVHDARVEPGAVYRYRLQVVFNNPFFGNAAALLPDQQALAAEPFISSQWSEWGQPTNVEQDRYYFVTAASVSDALGAQPRAQVEVFEFYYGYWRRGTANLSGGDLVTAKLELPAPDLRPIYDLEQSPSSTGANPNSPGSNPNSPDNEMDPQRRAAEDRRRLAGGGGQPATPNAPTAANLPPINALAVPGPETLPPIPTNAVLLDVTTLPGGQDSGMAGVGARTIIQAIFRNSQGRIETRSPDTDRTNATYRRLRQSAEEGLRQGIPEEPVEPEDIFVPPPPPPERDRGPSAPPGGGGGGGGGG